jgi:hypothetical protein
MLKWATMMSRRLLSYSNPYTKCLTRLTLRNTSEWHWLLERNSNLGYSGHELNTGGSYTCTIFCEMPFCLLVSFLPLFHCSALVVPVGCGKTEQGAKLWLRNKRKKFYFSAVISARPSLQSRLQDAGVRTRGGGGGLSDPAVSIWDSWWPWWYRIRHFSNVSSIFPW